MLLAALVPRPPVSFPHSVRLRIVPRAVVEDIRRGASREDFAKGGYAREISHPLASNLAFTQTSTPVYEAVADLLMR